MKFAIAAWALWVSTTLASPAKADYSIRRAEDGLLSIEDMSWTGSVFPGSPEVTLHGSAKSIYDQIMQLNPHYSAFDFPDLVEEFAAEGITKENFNETFGEPLATHGLERRASISCNHGKWIGNFANQCGEGYVYMKKLARLGRRCGAAKYKCARVSCSNNCGMFYCNNNKDKAISAKCGDILNDILQIARSCPESDSFPDTVRGRKSFSMHYVELSSSRC